MGVAFEVLAILMLVSCTALVVKWTFLLASPAIKRAWPPKGMNTSERVMRIAGFVLGAAVIGGVLWWFGLSAMGYIRGELKTRHEKERETQRSAQRTALAKDSIRQMLNRYQAVPVQLNEPGMFTAAYQDLLIRPDRKPALFLGELEDVVRTGDDTYSLVFDHEEPTQANLTVNVGCDAHVGKQMAQARSLSRWAILAVITSVVPRGPDSLGVTAQGSCVAFVPLDGTSIEPRDLEEVSTKRQ